MAGIVGGDVGTGATLVLGGTAGAAFTVAANITDMSFSGASRETVETTHLTTARTLNTPNTVGFGSRTYVAGRLSDPGELTLELIHDPENTPPLDADADTIVVTYAGGDGVVPGAIWSTNGHMTSYEVNGIGVDTLMTATAVFKLSGAVALTIDGA